MSESKNKYKFIDLFAGIGGFRLALERAGFECVASSEIDNHACEMYQANFGDNPKSDIRELDADKLPDFDVLCAGFPCQTFSICGKQKGFYDEVRGTLFFEICRILEHKKPKAFILENVQNLEKHDKGRTLKIMLQVLNDLGYSVNYKVLNAKDFGVPQNRERVIIVGNRGKKLFDFNKLNTNPKSSMKEFLETKADFEILKENEYTIIKEIKRQPKSGLIFIGYRNKKIRTVGVREGTEHLSRVHKQPNRIYSADGTHPTLASQESSGRYWIYVDGKVRKLTIDECYKFMGFPKDFKKVGLKSKLYERIGNSVCVNVIEAVANELYNQFFTHEGEDHMATETIPNELLERIYKEASQTKNINDFGLTQKQQTWTNHIVEYEETCKGVYSVLVTSLTYKILNPTQDVRRHQASLENGYSGRSFDTRHITPFLKQKQFYGAMKESGWLTRSLEQNLPYNLDYPGRISVKNVKNAFLSIMNDIEENQADPEKYLLAIFRKSIIEKSKKMITLVNPIESESNLSINEIMEQLEKHFYYKYSSRGASILPVVAVYSIYQVITDELKRFDGKYLEKLGSHNSSDRSSGATGDIVIRNKADNEIYEVVEVKFEIPIDFIMVNDAYNKIKDKKVQRYYILSTKSPKEEDLEKINEIIDLAREEHGCQIIVNGLSQTIKYYLRLIENTNRFITNYVDNIQNDNEINYEHKIAWNKIQQIFI